MELEIAAGVAILLAMLFLATIDLAFAHISDVGLRRLSADAEDGQNTSSAVFLREIIENRPRFRFALSSAIQVLLIAFAVVITLISTRITESRAGMVFTALLLGIAFTVLFRQIVPRFFIRKEPEKTLMFLLPVVKPIYRIASVVSAPFMPPPKSRDIHRTEITTAPDAGDEDEDDNDEDFQALMDVGEAEGIIDEEERELIESMVEFSDTRAGEIMTPRTEICSIPIDATVREARDLMVEEKYSRLPVYRATIDNIEGLIYVRDLLQAWAEGRENESIQTLLRDPYFVPETKSASELLKGMQSAHVQIAIVIDEYGGVAGIVTVEDILEEIVGEIEDEDIEEEEIIEIIEGQDGYFDVLGSTEIGKIERLFDMEIEDDDFTTIAGLITTDAGYVPKIGETLTFRGLEVSILRADEKRISLVRLRKHEPESVHVSNDPAD
jgi:CBS domain containing-hemolysin-like protein